ncbi:MAG: hypothetical protein M1827_005340 [Pycnora praestabilis]|nr:MAG: hypothetical protein M1827_005340 [Pycnora praestabilis]
MEVRNFASLDNKSKDGLLKTIMRTEKKTFPAREAFDFNTELRKRNTHMLCAFNTNGTATELLGYLAYVRIMRSALIHKVCVVQQHRRKGIAKNMLSNLRDQLGNLGCTNMRLWVDENREPALSLYTSCGFTEVDRVADYYAPGRNGLQMVFLIEST